MVDIIKFHFNWRVVYSHCPHIREHSKLDCHICMKSRAEVLTDETASLALGTDMSDFIFLFYCIKTKLHCNIQFPQFHNQTTFHLNHSVLFIRPIELCFLKTITFGFKKFFKSLYLVYYIITLLLIKLNSQTNSKGIFFYCLEIDCWFILGPSDLIRFWKSDQVKVKE